MGELSGFILYDGLPIKSGGAHQLKRQNATELYYSVANFAKVYADCKIPVRVQVVYSATGCVAYRSINGNVGTAFGWGIAKTKEEADAIATKECLKRSGGIQPTNFVWSCNAAQAAHLKEIYNASPEITVPAKIGNQVWTSTNLNVSTYRNGEQIYYAANQKEWEKVSKENIPAYCYLNFDSNNEKKYGKLYNFYAVTDGRGLAPAGWHVPTSNEFLTLIAALGGENVAGKKMRATKGWDVKDSYNFAHGNGDNSSGLNLLPNKT